MKEPFWETSYGRYRRLKKLGINAGISAPLKNNDIALSVAIACALYLSIVGGKYLIHPIAKTLILRWPILGVVLVLLIGQLLFQFKKEKLIWYGRVEVAFSLVAGFMSLTNVKNPSWVTAFVGSIYIYVRGASNIHDAKLKSAKFDGDNRTSLAGRAIRDASSPN